MSGISQSAAVRAARHALYNAIKTALEDEQEVDIVFSFRHPFVYDDWFMLTELSTDMPEKIISPRRQQDEEITFHASVGSFRPGHDEATDVEVFDRAFELLAKVQDHIRKNDPTLNGTVLWCVPSGVASDAATAEQDSVEGRLVEIDATFTCAHRIRTTGA